MTIRAQQPALAAEFVWAIDPGVARVAAAFISRWAIGQVAEVDTLQMPTLEPGGARLGMLARRLRDRTEEWCHKFPPACVWVEQPSGAVRNLALAYAVGVIQAAIWEATGAPIFMIAPASWKLEALGHGNATKDEIREWVAEHGVQAASQDEADAAAIAHAGRRKVVRGSWK